MKAGRIETAVGLLRWVALVSSAVLPPTPGGVDTPVWGPAQLTGKPSAAFDGTNFLMAWEDRRGTGPDIVVARMSADGTVVDPENILLPAGGERLAPAVAFDGANFLVVWEERASSNSSAVVRGLRVQPNGQSIGSVFAVSRELGECTQPAIAFDGTNYAVACVDNSSPSIQGARVSPAGVALDKPPKTLLQGASAAISAPVLLYDRGQFLLAWYESGKVRLSRFASDLTAVDAVPVTVASPADSPRIGLESDGTHLWLAFSRYDAAAMGSAVLAQRIGRDDLLPIGAPIIVAPSTSGRFTFPTVGFDGSAVGVIYSPGGTDDEDLYGTWFDPDGAVVGASNRKLVSEDAAQFGAILAHGGGMAPLGLAWIDTRHGGAAIYASRLGASGQVLDAGGRLVSRALNEQTTPVIAASNGAFFVSWIDSREGGYQVYGTPLDTQAAPIRSSAVPLVSGYVRKMNAALASDGAQYLAVWNEIDFSGKRPLAARLIAADGTLLGQPLALAPDFLAPAVAFAGGVYLVVGTRFTSTAAEVVGVRVASNGQMLDTAPFLLEADAPHPTVASDGTQFMVAWRSGQAAVGTRVSRDGQRLDMTPLPLSPAGVHIGSNPQLAFGRGSFLVVWDSLDVPYGVRGVRVDSNGTLLDAVPIDIALNGTVGTTSVLYQNPNVAFDGSRFAIVMDAKKYNGGTAGPTELSLTRLTPLGAFQSITSLGTLDASNLSSDVRRLSASGGRSVVVSTRRDRPAGYDLDRVRIQSVSDQKSTIGGSCATNTDCAAGTCVDGVCCETACSGGALDCQACSVVAGAASNGKCTSLPDGRACGARGSCGAGICIELPDAGPPDASTDAARESGASDSGSDTRDTAAPDTRAIDDGALRDAIDAESRGPEGGEIPDARMSSDSATDRPDVGPPNVAVAGPGDAGCGCRMTPRRNLPAASGLLLAFFALCRRARKRRE